MQLPVVVFLGACLALSSAQRFASPNPNNVDEYDYEDAPQAPARHHAPQPRSYAPNQARISALAEAKPTPVPILKQINRHNDDGSYTYGYEGADGSFKIETKLVTGEVMGKYGYVDDSGKVRVVEYGANRYGFQPAGEGITVAPPTLVDETRTQKPGRASLGALSLSSGLSQRQEQQNRESLEDIYDDGQYYEEPAPQPAPRPAARPAARPRVQPTPQYFENSFSAPAAAARPSQIPNNFAQFSQSTNFGPSSFGSTSFGPAPRAQPATRYTASPSLGSFGSFGSSSSLGPVPPRAQIAGAAPIGAPLRPVAPAPVREHQPAPSPAPQALFVPQHQQPQQPQLSHLQPSRRPSPGGGGLLDQLARDYALPQNAAQQIVDTSFGVY